MPMYKNYLLVLSWVIPPSLVALISGIAVLKGVEHEWLNIIFVVCLGLSPLAIIYASGLCIALHEAFEKKNRELELSNLSFSANEQKTRQLQEEIEKLTGMREIQMSSHIDSFSDVLKNILKITHIATEARALTIYLESHNKIGMAFPKTHMRWEPHSSKLPGEIFIFFNEELILETKDVESLGYFEIDHFIEHSDENQNIELCAAISCREISIGEIYYRNTLNIKRTVEENKESISNWLRNFDLRTSGIFSCWQTRSSITHETETSAYVSVPILSQGLMVGVLSAEFHGLQQDHHSKQELKKHRNILLDYGRNIGQPLKKEELYEQAIKDALTGLFNKAHYENQLHEHFHRMCRYERDLSFIFLDIDHFKNINDSYGHITGDMALKSVSKIIVENIRKSDIAFRIGGEELCVLLIETGLEESLAVAEKLREVIERSDFPKEGGGHIHFTASFGVACLTSDMKEPNDLVSVADKAVYQAKRTGRNKVVSFEEILELETSES